MLADLLSIDPLLDSDLVDLGPEPRVLSSSVSCRRNRLVSDSLDPALERVGTGFADEGQAWDSGRVDLPQVERRPKSCFSEVLDRSFSDPILGALADGCLSHPLVGVEGAESSEPCFKPQDLPGPL